MHSLGGYTGASNATAAGFFGAGGSALGLSPMDSRKTWWANWIGSRGRFVAMGPVWQVKNRSQDGGISTDPLPNFGIGALGLAPDSLIGPGACSRCPVVCPGALDADGCRHSRRRPPFCWPTLAKTRLNRARYWRMAKPERPWPSAEGFVRPRPFRPLG
jgi:hypothetical protein